MKKKRTHEEFVELVRIEGYDEYEVLSQYKNAHEKVMLLHKTCNRNYTTSPNNFIRGSRCPECQKENRKLTQNEFEKNVKKLYEGEYTVVGDYAGRRTKVQLKHNVCNTVWNVLPDSFLQGSGCPTCARARTGKAVSERLKHSHHDFIEKLFEIVGNEYSALSTYTLSKQKVKMKHNLCGYEWEVVPNNFLNTGTRCPKCALESKTKSHHEFKEEIYELVKEEYSLVTKYINSNIKVSMKHNDCGYIWEVAPYSFLLGSRCPKCSLKNRIMESKKKQDVIFKNKINEEFILVSKYIDARTKVTLKHSRCGYEWEIYPSSINNDNVCPKCFQLSRLKNIEREGKVYKIDKNLTQSHSEFFQKLARIKSYEYVPLEEYINSSIKILFKHRKCGHKWYTTPSTILQSNCPKCARDNQKSKMTKTQDEFVKEIYKLVGDEYVVTGTYTKSMEKVKLKHVHCGYEWRVKPHDFITNGSRCPKCRESKGEKLVSKILNNMNIDYMIQKRFLDCRDKLPLPFDFIISDKILVEYDGELHFKKSNYYGGGKGLFNRIKKDKIKNNYCIENNIPLIRIPYWEFDNIGYILDNVLHHFNIKKLEDENTYNQEIVKQYLVDSNWNHEIYISWQHKENFSKLQVS